jgi:PAS domain S-box-containing protein
LRIRDLLRPSYESQIRISLVFLILFLILLNFGTEYLFHHTKRLLKHQNQQQLATTALSASLIWEKSPQQALKKNLMELSFKSEVNQISFLSLDGKPLISSREIRSGDGRHVFRGVEPELLNLLKAKGKKQKSGGFFSDFYTDGSGAHYLSYYFPLESQNTGTSVWVTVEKEVSGLAKIEKLSTFNALFRLVGLFAAALVTLLLLRNLLAPYRLMVRKARKERVIPASEKGKGEGELDVAVGIFEQVIRELKEKEKTLQELYRKTDRKAKNLASYNEYILRSISSGMIICDEEGRIIRMNHPAEMILGKKESAALGKHHKTVLGEDSPLCSVIQMAFEEQRASSIPEIRLTKRNGESVPLSLSSSAVKDEQGRTLGAAILLTDLTEIKRLEERMAFKDKMATLGEMASGLAHELRNSMGAVLGFGKLLNKRKDDPRAQSQAIDGIVHEAMCMESMLQRFLAFAKPFQLKIEKIDLKQIIQECRRSVDETLKENQIAFTFDFDPDLPAVLGDRILLKQCFQNLIQNSIQAMPDGGRLRVSLEEKQCTPEEKTIVVQISDTGCGIAEEDQDKIFNPFFTSREKGTGLGLSLVKKIVSLHNGKTELESELGKGTTFIIHLPAKPHLKSAPTSSEGKHELEPVIFSHPANADDSNTFE